MNKLDKIVNFLMRLQITVGIISVAIIGIIIPLQVFFRYILKNPLIWPEDIGIGLMVWIGFLGASVLYKRGEHIAVEYFKNQFPKKISIIITFLIDLMIGFITILIIIYSFKLNKLQMMTMQVGTGLPRGYFFSLPILVNMSFLFVYNLHSLLRRIVSNIREE